MLNHLKLNHVGPAPEMQFEFAPRINLLTGNNSLGKTFILDVAWWALTQSWPGKDPKRTMAWPLAGKRKEARIGYSYQAKTTPVSHESRFDAGKEQWPARRGRPGNPGLVLCVRTDGGFSLWDPARNYWRKSASRDSEDGDRPRSFDFTMDDIWNGLREGGNVYCEGLLSDWKTWRDRNGWEYALLKKVLPALSPHQEEWMTPGEFTRLSVSDVRDIPTIETPYGVVPVTLTSASVKRVLGLAYLIVWAHTEHIKACELLGEPRSDRFTVLIDEVEQHLHPQWQRVLLPAVLDVISGLGAEASTRADGQFSDVQLIATTHAPMVMASVEPRFKEEIDKVFHFKLENGSVSVEDIAWTPQGNAEGWLVSEVFGLEQARSVEAEQAIEAAEAYMRGDVEELPEGLRNADAIHQTLLQVLPDHDKFWPRWIVQTTEGP
ncbi:MAG: AAA family ATPase [Candidatus Hydrogenedentota bacterium]